jgi:hypothetical protein
VESSCELGNETSGSIKILGNYRVTAQVVASQVVLSSTELVIVSVSAPLNEYKLSDI